MKNLSERINYAKKSLIGLSVGDAFGETFFGEENGVLQRIADRQTAHGEWHFTDDTVMGISIYKILEQFGEIHQDHLAKLFAKNYVNDVYRGYGGTAHSILRSIGDGNDWREVSASAFDGMGSMGNGAAMRAAPIGAFFYDDIEKIKEQAELSAQITHYNEEGIAGAQAVALAAGLALEQKLSSRKVTAEEFIEKIFLELPECDTKYKVRKAVSIPKEANINFVVSVLGNGVKVIAQDTVPFAIWCIAHYRDNYEEALWKAVSALGDRDTICAIVGSVVVLNTGIEAVPNEWIESREPLESSIFW